MAELAIVTAAHVVDLLKARHARDIAVAEAPLAPWGGLRADLWVMTPSWTRHQVTIYEVKVARGDFLRDEKWHRYLPFCNSFSFVAPAGVLQKEEIPEGAGLLEVSANGSRLRTVRKAPRRQDDHEHQAQVLKAILMNRASITPSRYGRVDPSTREQRMAEWQMLLEEGKPLGHKVGGAIREEMERLRKAADDANRRANQLEEFQQDLERAGWDRKVSVYQFRSDLQATRAKMPEGLPERLNTLHESVRALRELFHP